jgi:TatD DNase family protein
MLTDSHAHIQSEEYAGEVAAVIARAREAGVQTIITVGGAGDISNNAAAIALAESFAEIFATVGMHPHDAKEVGDNEVATLRKFAAHPRVVAIGETGLDYYYDHSPREIQRQVFSRFIQLACETNLPIIVHEREAFRDSAELLRIQGAGKLAGVVHCFTGDYAAAARYLDLGLYLSFTGIITFKNADALREVVRKVPLNKILVETDAPFLTPVPYRGKRNEPAYVRLVAEAVARIKNLPLEQVAETTTASTRELFRLP